MQFIIHLNSYVFYRFTPTLRYVLPDEVSKSLGQGQGGRVSSTAHLKKSLHRIFCFPFFIFVLEPLVLRVFFLYASINFMTTYFMFSHLMKSNRFHYSFPLILSLITFEFLLFLFSFQLPKKEEARSIFTYTPPSNSKILLSLFGSFIIELIKKRKFLHKLINPHNENREELEAGVGVGGMPPSYMVVSITWDWENEEENNLARETKGTDTSLLPTKSSECKSYLYNYYFITKIDLTKFNKTFCSNKKSEVAHFLLNHLAVMLTKLKHLDKMRAQPHSTVDKNKFTSTENNEDICRLLTNKLTMLLVSSTVGVDATLYSLPTSLVYVDHVIHISPPSTVIVKVHTNS